VHDGLLESRASGLLQLLQRKAARYRNDDEKMARWLRTRDGGGRRAVDERSRQKRIVISNGT
jgi:hypothetical protein